MDMEKKDAHGKELEEILSSPEDKMFSVPVMMNMELTRERFAAYRHVIFMIELHEKPEDVAAKREEFLSAMFSSGLDRMVAQVTEAMVKDMVRKMLGGE